MKPVRPEILARFARQRPPRYTSWRLTPEDQLRRDIIERIMCDFRVDLAAVAAGHGVRPEYFMAEPARLADLEQDGIVRLDGAVVALEEAFGRWLAPLPRSSMPICSRRNSVMPLRSE